MTGWLRQHGCVGSYLLDRRHGGAGDSHGKRRGESCQSELHAHVSGSIRACAGSSGECGTRGRRDFAVEPILLMGQRGPRLRHAQVALEGGLTVGALCQLQTVIRVFSEDV